MKQRATKVLFMETGGIVADQMMSKVRSWRMEPVFLDSYRELKGMSGEELQGFFAAIVDHSLTDAPNGEHIKRLSDNSLPVIVMAGEFGQALREHILSLGALDYVYKSDKRMGSQLRYILENLRYLDGKKALVVNDSKMQTFILKKFLGQLRIKTTCVNSAEEGLQILQQDPKFLLILTDYILPRMDGVDFVFRLRQRFRSYPYIVMAMTGTISDDLFARIIKAGADDILSKPFRREELNQRIFRETELLFWQNKYRRLAEQYKQQKSQS